MTVVVAAAWHHYHPLPSPLQVKAFGPGLKGGLVGNPAEFTIDTKGAGTGGLGLTVEGPTEAKIECSDNGDGTCSVSYLPTEPGDYVVNILFEEVHIPGSPFKADIQMPFDPSKVVASGSGLKRGKVRVRRGRQTGELELKIQQFKEAHRQIVDAFSLKSDLCL